MFEVEPYTNRIRANFYQDDSREMACFCTRQGLSSTVAFLGFVVSQVECFVDRREIVNELGKEMALHIQKSQISIFFFFFFWKQLRFNQRIGYRLFSSVRSFLKEDQISIFFSHTMDCFDLKQ